MATTETTTNAAQPSFNLPFANPEWLKQFTDAPAKFYSSAWNQLLGLSASYLQDQADYVKKLSQCTDPAEALKCHGDFAKKSWAHSCDESSKILDTIRTNFSSGPVR